MRLSREGKQSPVSEVSREQEYIGRLYERIDALRGQASARLALALRENGGTAQSRLDRDAAIAGYAGQLARLDAAEDGLCFGRLDLRTGELRRIGRIGLRAEPSGDEPLLIDWRAPAARAFYVATAGAPHGVRRRRHIIMRGRRVTGVDDEVLDRGELAGTPGLTGEAALLAALAATRTGRMRDIVGTLQAEQDAIIRSVHSGILVVQGGPGTGKTAVALHRAAYLLYTHRRLAERGVLVVGPSTTFLGYISQVLPGLGETNVLLCTVGELFPGVTADRCEGRLAQEVKGRAMMTGVLAAAVRGRQATGPADIEFGGETLRLTRQVVQGAARRARATRLPHNEARPLFQRQIIAALAEQYAERARELAERLEADVAGVLAEAREAIEADLATLPEIPGSTGDDGQPDLAEVRRELWADPGVRARLDDLWPVLTPQRLLEWLFADPARLASAAPALAAAERAALLREPGGWSTADVPLLDEAAELLGRDERAVRARSAREQAQRIAYAQGVLDIAAGSADSSDEVLGAADLLDAGELAARQEAAGRQTVAERAAADRTWTFGHVIVDEAQELSHMAWRLLARRCPAKSMTIVGDIAQTGGPAGTTSWERVLEPLAGHRWRLARLTVNYRTPAEIMAATADLLAAIDPGQQPPQSVRETGVPPWRMATTRDALPAALAEITAAEAASAGRLAIIVPDARVRELGEAVSRAVPDVSFGDNPDLTSEIVLLGATQAKGLEFDSVLIADPGAILAASPRGRNDLYVAMTRSTQRLGIVHPGPPPAEITALRLRQQPAARLPVSRLSLARHPSEDPHDISSGNRRNAVRPPCPDIDEPGLHQRQATEEALDLGSTAGRDLGHLLPDIAELARGL
jgi:DNA helicase IV